MTDPTHISPNDGQPHWPFLASSNLDTCRACFIAPTASLIGWVHLGWDTSIWYGAVLRGDVERILIGDRTNIQDGAVLHGDPGQVTQLDEDVTVGHGAVVHSAHIKAGSMIGIKSVVLNGVTIGQGSIVGAGAVVTKSIPPRSMALGVPAKVVRELSEEEIASLVTHAHHYVQLARHHAQVISLG